MSTSNTSSSTSASIDKRSFDEQSNATDMHRSRQFAKTNSATKMIVHNFLANIFIKEVNLILYNDCKDRLYQKNNIASLFLDEFIICYVEEVQIKWANPFRIKHLMAYFFYRNGHLNLVLKIFKLTIICIQRANTISRWFCAAKLSRKWMPKAPKISTKAKLIQIHRNDQ